MYVHASLIGECCADGDNVLLLRPVGNIECPVSLANTLPRFSTCVGLRGLALVRGC